MFISKEQIIEAVSAMSVMDVMELVSAMEEKFGVSSRNVIFNTRDEDNTDANVSGNLEEQTEFNVVLKSIGINKVSVIKAVRSATGLGLKESKDLVESAPVVLKEGISKNEAEALKKSLEETGAEIEIK